MAMATAVTGTSTLQRHFLLGSSIPPALGLRQARPLLLRSISAKLGLKDEGKLPAEERVLPAANALAAAALAAMAAAPSPAAAREIAALAAVDGDSRGLAVLGVLLPAIGWVLFNILRPALNQLDQMKASKGFVAAIGGAATAAAVGSMVVPAQAEAAAMAAAREIGSIAAGESDNRGLLLLLVILPALGWVVFNILKPALNQFENMKK